jgi:GNAT superfamily N-acetyltransferase
VNDGTAATSQIAIRTARADDFPTLQEIEIDAGLAFAEIGMGEVAQHDPFSIAELTAYQVAGHAWVAVALDGSRSDDRPVAYLVVDIVAGNAHIEQVSVRPRFARRGIGRTLIDHVAIWARGHGRPALTLTTFRDVAWNAPYYERCGFRTLPADEVTPELAAIRRHEAELGLDRWPRVCMRREIET